MDLLALGQGDWEVARSAAEVARNDWHGLGLIGEEALALRQIGILQLMRGEAGAARASFEEGLDAVYARHHRLAEGCRRAIAAWGLALCAKAPKWNSDTVSAIMVPAGINAAKVIDIAYRRYNMALGAGLSEMAGKLFRIGHLGDLNELMLLGAIAGAEMSMRDTGMQVTPGSGVAAASEYYRSTAPSLGAKDNGAGSPDAQARVTGGSRATVAA